MSSDAEPRKSLILRQAAKGLFWLLFAAITVIALLPGPAAPPRLLGTDKIEHAAAFGVLSFLAAFGWRGLPLWFVALALFTHGAVIELVQGSPILQRTTSFADLAANAVGIALALMLIWFLGLRRR
ncbi:teicoplanin resistance protein VanZ [Hyphobacterium sp.]|uniref:teicoplanin resistance protein VanZ n=1 Tax=Hyphobacterium sp. TaxID=2004662 RepID=UPI003BAB8165